MTKTDIIEHAWASFAERVISPSAPQIQLDEIRMAFFSGAHVVLTAMLMLAEHRVSDAAGVTILESMHAECRKFSDAFGPVATNPGRH